MPERFLDLTAFVLAGGAGSRMGRPKHDLKFGDATLLIRAVRLARSVARTVAVLGPPDRLAGVAEAAFGTGAAAAGLAVPAYPDHVPGQGPLGAILGALSRTRTEFNLVLSCDLPLMPATFLRFVVRRAFECGADVTLAETPPDGYQPLAAVYRRRARFAIRNSLKGGQRKVSRFFPRVKVRRLGWPELARAGFRRVIFDNLNTPEDYEAALRRSG